MPIFSVKDAAGATVYFQVDSGSGSPIDPYIIDNSVAVSSVPANPFGTNTDTAVTTDANGSLSGKLRGVIVLILQLLARLPTALGQKNKAGSFPVTLASDQEAFEVARVPHPDGFGVNMNFSSAQTARQLVEAPGAGLRLYLTDIIISTDTPMQITLVEDTEGEAAAVAGPYYFAANGGMAAQLGQPLMLSAGTDLGFTSSAAGNHTITLLGYIAG